MDAHHAGAVGLSHAQLGVFFLDTEVEGASMQRTVSGSRDGDFLQWAVVSSGGMYGECLPFSWVDRLYIV